MTMQELLKACSDGTMPVVKSSVPIRGATDNVGQVQEIKFFKNGIGGIGVSFPGLNYNTWFHVSDGTDQRSKYMSQLTFI